MNLLAKYTNGNYVVRLYDDGTKVKSNKLDNFTPDFAESIDITITNKCDGACDFCYADCTVDGKHGNLNLDIFDSVHAGTELALNANDLTHPYLENFLIKMRDKNVICNITINQRHLLPNLNKLKDWQDKKLVWGIGVSLTNSTDPKLYEAMAQLKNAIIHVIDGCFTKFDLENLYGHDFAILFLGFKHKGRGIDYYNKHKESIKSNIKFLSEHLYDYKNGFRGFCFDTISLENLEIKSVVSEDAWATHHMGEEGEFTFYISLPDMTYSISSMENEHIFPIKENDTLDSMFKHIREVSGF